jgi:hypothetical protein
MERVLAEVAVKAVTDAAANAASTAVVSPIRHTIPQSSIQPERESALRGECEMLRRTVNAMEAEKAEFTRKLAEQERRSEELRRIVKIMEEKLAEQERREIHQRSKADEVKIIMLRKLAEQERRSEELRRIVEIMEEKLAEQERREIHQRSKADEVKIIMLRKLAEQERRSKVYFVMDDRRNCRLIGQLELVPDMPRFEVIETKNLKAESELIKHDRSFVCRVFLPAAKLEDDTENILQTLVAEYGNDRVILLISWNQSESDWTLMQSMDLVPSVRFWDRLGVQRSRLLQWRHKVSLRLEDPTDKEIIDKLGAVSLLRQIMDTIR